MVKRRLLLGLWVVTLAVGCIGGIDLGKDGTTMTATAAGDGTTEVRICPGPGLISCAEAGAFHVSAGGEERAATPGFLGGFDVRLAAAVGEVRVTRDADGASAAVTLPDAFDLGGARSGATVRLGWQPSARPDRMTWSAVTSCQSGRSVATAG